MNHDTLGLIVFAITALGAVYAFIFVLGGEPQATGDAVVGEIVPASSTHYRSAERACKYLNCDDGLSGVPTGRYDAARELYECKCQTSNPASLFYRSRYAKRISR